MQNNGTPSSVWQRRTHRLVAAAVIVIGLTMMISNITQCIYMGMVFIMVALVWLAWITMKERKVEPPRPQAHQSPVVFLVTSQMLPHMSRSNALDKPPSYDTIVSLDGLPPAYSSVQFEKPPRYEEAAAIFKAARHSDFAPHEASAGPSGVVMFEKADQAMEGTGSGRKDVFPRLDDARVGERDGMQHVAPTDEDINDAVSRTSPPNTDVRDRRDDMVENARREDSFLNVLNAVLDDNDQRGSRLSTLHPKTLSASQSFRSRQDLREENRERTRNASANDGRNSEATADGNLRPSKSLMLLQVPTLSQDTAGSAAWYLASSDTTNSTLPSVHSQNVGSRISRTLPSTSEGCEAPPSATEFSVSPAGRAENQDQREDVAGRTKACKLQHDAQTLPKSFNCNSSADLGPSTRRHHRMPY